jgi:hypothetical protein
MQETASECHSLIRYEHKPQGRSEGGGSTPDWTQNGRALKSNLDFNVVSLHDDDDNNNNNNNNNNNLNFLLAENAKNIIRQTRPYTEEILEFNNPLSSLLEICRTKQKRSFFLIKCWKRREKKRG